MKSFHLRTGKLFILTGIISLTLSLVFGVFAAIQFLYPEFLPELAFYKTRPLHTALAVSWIFSIGIGVVYNFLENHTEYRFKVLGYFHWLIYVITGTLIISSYFKGVFGGREYWEFPPVLSIPILVSWVLFSVVFFSNVFRLKNWPVYIWMWSTGIIIFLLSFAEANLWIFDYFDSSLTREITVQWKSYGSLVGSWNMLVYGTGLFVMENISEDKSYAQSKMAFTLYFVGLTNLFFNWAHHIYIVPSAEWIRLFAYIISMTELFILGRIIWKWKSTLSEIKKHKNKLAYQFIVASDIWVFLNLTLAIIISVPAINLYTHGTHVTVAHAMGSTIGINSFILISYLLYNFKMQHSAWIKIPYWMINISLLVFWISLITAGTIKGYLLINNQESFYIAMSEIMTIIRIFMFSGIVIALGFGILLFHLLAEYVLDFPENVFSKN